MPKTVHFYMPHGKVFSQKYYQNHLGKFYGIQGNRAYFVPPLNSSYFRSEKIKPCQKQTTEKIKNNNQIRIFFYYPIVERRKKKHQKQTYSKENNLLFKIKKISSRRTVQRNQTDKNQEQSGGY